MNNSKIVLIIMFLVLFSLCFGQYDEKEIIKNNIDKLIKSRQYERAKIQYKEALVTYPNDIDLIEGLIQQYIRSNDSKALTQILADKDKILPDSLSGKHRINLKLMNSQSELALSQALDYLQSYSNLSNFNDITKLFTRYRAYVESIELYKIANNKFPGKFNLNIADSYYYIKDYSQALLYYFKVIEKESRYIGIVNMRIKNMIIHDSAIIEDVIKYFGDDIDSIIIDNNNKKVFNVYLEALINGNKNDKVLSLMSKYSHKDIYVKAEQLKRDRNYDLSGQLYNLAISKVTDNNNKLSYMLKLADLYLVNKQLVKSDSLATDVINFSGKVRNKDSYLFQAYITKANIEKSKNGINTVYLDKLKLADRHANSSNSKKEVSILISKYHILHDNHKEAHKELSFLERYDVDSQILFNSFLYEFLNSSAETDSLLTELVISFPSSQETLEALTIKFYTKELTPQNNKLFQDAYRYKALKNITKADSLYQSLYEASSNEIFIIMNAEMNKNNMLLDRALVLYSNNFQDEFCRDYAELQIVNNSSRDREEVKTLARNFLTKYPNSSFAPGVRLHILEQKQEEN